MHEMHPDEEGEMMDLYVIYLTDPDASGRLDRVLDDALKDAEKKVSVHWIESADDLCDAAEHGELEQVNLLFAVDLDESGINMEMMEVLRYLHRNRDCLTGSVGGVIIDGVDDYYTKDAGRRLAFAANMAGCTLPGKPLVEGTGSLRNFDILAKNLKTTNRGAYGETARQLVEKILSFRIEENHHPKVLVVHASSRKTSNSLLLWSKVAQHLEGHGEIEEISLRDGEVWDCRGCKYEACVHFGEKSSCFYGGVMVEKIYPAIIKGDILVLICPNYNDAIGANIMAFINRLTAVFRTNDFSRKRVYAIVVSGYSGGDIVAQQIMGAINMNKNFILPAKFALMATANNPGSVLEIEDIDQQAAEFAEQILLKDQILRGERI